MLLSDIFEQLTYGELKQFSIGGFSSGAIQPKDYPEVISHINLGLLSLYTKFPVLEKELIIELQEGISIYQLDYAYAESNPAGADVKYIQDTTDAPFLDDLLRIDSAYTAWGDELRLNDDAVNSIDYSPAQYSLFIPSWDSVQVPNGMIVQDDLIYIIYRAKPVKITNDVDPTTYDVFIPETMLEALLQFVVSRVHSGRTGQEAEQSSIIAKQKYEAICVELEMRNILNSADNRTNIKLDENGWV